MDAKLQALRRIAIQSNAPRDWASYARTLEKFLDITKAANSTPKLELTKSLAAAQKSRYLIGKTCDFTLYNQYFWWCSHNRLPFFAVQVYPNSKYVRVSADFEMNLAFSEEWEREGGSLLENYVSYMKPHSLYFVFGSGAEIRKIDKAVALNLVEELLALFDSLK